MCRTSSRDVLDEPTSLSSSPTRRSISAMVLVSGLLSSFLAVWSFVVLTVCSSSRSRSSPRTAPTSLALPSFPFRILSNLPLTSTSPRISSPGSTLSTSRSLAIFGFDGSASSASKAASSVCKDRSLAERDNERVFVGSLYDESSSGGYVKYVRCRS